MKKSSFVASMLVAVMFTLGAAIPGSAASVGGSTVGTYRVAAHSSRIFTRSFYAGETARVAVRGDGDTELDLYVYDTNGNLITFDEDDTVTCLAEWTPRWKGQFIIKVVNRGDVYNDFTIATN